MTDWLIKNKNIPLDSDLTEKYGHIIIGLLHNRGIIGGKEIENFFSFDYEKDLDCLMDLPEIKKAVERVKKARKNGERVAIFGDYDADGVTASVLMHDVLTDLGFKNLTSYIPDRQTEGYGMNEEALVYLKDKGVKLIITVDCGITNVLEVAQAQKMGIDVIVTDHHHVLPDLPKATAVINPHMDDSGFSFKDYSGVGVAFKLAQALYKEIEPAKIDQLKWALDLVGIGTIADCVDLLGENRVLVKYGLLVLSKTRRVGLREMFQVGRIVVDENNIPDAHKVSFQIAPRINAAGRMDHASTSYQLLIETNKAKARELALELEDKNQNRQKITGEIMREVRILADNMFKNKPLIIAENEHWPAGILGLVAGKIAEEYAKPTIIMQKQEKEFVGSLRSIPEVDIMEALKKCSDLLQKFGGHSQAAGIRINPDRAVEFYSRIEKIVGEMAKDKKFVSTLDIDLEIGVGDINWDLMDKIRKMEPFGEGNPEPIFLMRNMKIYDLKVCGNGSKHLKLSLGSVSGGPKIFDSIGFGLCEKFPELKVGEIIDVVFNLCEDSWNGNKKMQLKLIDLKLCQK